MLAKRLNYYLATIIVVSGVFIFMSIQDGHNWGGDFSLYVNQSIHISEGFNLDEVYKWNKISMQNSIIETGPYLYPNGFPLLLSPIYSVFGVDFILMKFFCSIFFLLSIPLIFVLFKDFFKSITYPLILVCLIAFNYNYIEFSDNILSDFPYLFFCFLTFYLMPFKNNIQNQILLGVCLFYAYFIRDVGVFLMPTLFVYQLVNSKRYKNNLLITTIPYLIFVVLFFFVRYIFPDGGENHIEMMLSNLSFNLILGNLYYYNLLFSRILFFNIGLSIVGFLIIAISIIGAFINIKKHLPFIVFTLLNLVLLIIWPSVQGIRFLFPIFPFVLFFLMQGVKFILEKVNVSTKYLTITLTTYLVLFAIQSVRSTIIKCKVNSNEAFTSEMVEIYNYVSLNVPSEEIIGFKKPRVLWLFSDAKCIYTDIDHFDESIADYLLINRDSIKDHKVGNIQKEFKCYALLKKKKT